MNSQMLHKSFLFPDHQTQTLCCGSGTFPGSADVFCNKTAVWSAGFYTATAANKRRSNRNRSSVPSWTQRTQPGAARAWRPLRRGPQHRARPGLPSPHRTKVTVTQSLWGLSVCLRCGGFCWAGFALLYKRRPGHMYFKTKLTDFAALHLTQGRVGAARTPPASSPVLCCDTETKAELQQLRKKITECVPMLSMYADKTSK